MDLVNTGIKHTPYVQLNILLYFLCCGPIFMLEMDILFRRMDYIKYLQIKNQQVNDSVRNLTMGHVWIFLPDNNTNWAQNQASAMAIPVL